MSCCIPTTSLNGLDEVVRMILIVSMTFLCVSFDFLQQLQKIPVVSNNLALSTQL